MESVAEKALAIAQTMAQQGQKQKCCNLNLQEIQLTETEMRYRELTKDCKKCGGKGILFEDINGRFYAKNCECIEKARKKIQAESRLAFADIPKPLKDVAIKDFKTDIYSTKQAQKLARNVLEAVVYYIKHFEEVRREGKGLYLYSDTKGSGKTMLAVAIANYLLKNTSYTVKFSTMVDILREIKNTYNPNTQQTESELVKALGEVEVLVIDDIGVEVPTAWATEIMQQIMNTRCLNKLVTIFTSNIHLKDLKYDGRIKSRVGDMAIVLQMPEESIRDSRAEESNLEWMKKMLGIEK